MENTCLQTAAKYLAQRSYFTQELDDKLKLKGFARDERKQAIERLKELNFIDDRARAIDFISYYARKGNGPRWLLAQLMHKSDLSHGELERLIDEEFPFDKQLIVVQKLWEKKFAGQEDERSRAKIAAYFFRKGFDQSVLGHFLENCYNA